MDEPKFKSVSEKRAYFKKYREDTDKMMRANRPLPNGRNFVYWEHHEDAGRRSAYRDNFDLIRWDKKPPCTNI